MYKQQAFDSQIKHKDSLRDIQTGLLAHSYRWYHLGLTGVHKSTLSNAKYKERLPIIRDKSGGGEIRTHGRI
ncbi:MAG: DUF4372 domain-containing protein [Nitrospirae bacterium]|nr:DUF4372 domain-containing protein [Nitrospirota bacterium]